MGKDNFVISVRGVEGKGEKAKFNNEPGKTRYLVVPDGELPHPVNHMEHDPGDPEGKKWKEKWRKLVLKRAMCGRHKEDGHPLKDYIFGDVLIFIHGYNNSMKHVMQRHDLLQDKMGVQGYKGVVVSFDWPSATSTLNYMEDRSDAKATAQELVRGGIAFLADTQRDQERNKCDIDVHLLGHSTGAYVIREGFYEASHNQKVSLINWQVSQIALIGGDIARKSLSSSDSKSQALFRHATRITNYQNPNDSALKVSNVKRLGTQPRVGRVGLPDDSPENIVNVNVGEHWKDLDEEDSEASGNWSHSWHFGDALFAKDLVETIKGDIDRHAIPTRAMKNGELMLKVPDEPSGD